MSSQGFCFRVPKSSIQAAALRLPSPDSGCLLGAAHITQAQVRASPFGVAGSYECALAPGRLQRSPNLQWCKLGLRFQSHFSKVPTRKTIGVHIGKHDLESLSPWLDSHGRKHQRCIAYTRCCQNHGLCWDPRW